MGKKVVLFSGGKDSVYVALREWPVDFFVTFVYEFPRPSPHLLNISKVLELAGSMSVPMVVLKVHKGKEKEEEAELLSSLGASEIIAGDQGVEDHLKYMEELAKMAGAELKEPIWGLEPEKVLEDELKNMSFAIIGAEEKAKELLCKKVEESSADEFKSKLKELGVDPIGEAGEYHTLVTSVKKLGASVEFRCREIKTFGDYYIALLD